MKSKWMSIFVNVMIGILFLFAIRDSIGNIWLLVEGMKTKGIVTSFRSDTSNRKKTIKRPIFEYKIDGISHTIDGEGSSDLQYELNDEVNIFVSPANPDYAKVSSFLEMWLSPFLYIFVGSAVLALRFAFNMIFRTRSYKDVF